MIDDVLWVIGAGVAFAVFAVLVAVIIIGAADRSVRRGRR